jgi:hypothetical protein
MKRIALAAACLVSVTMPSYLIAAEGAMTAGDLQQVCVGADAASRAGCRQYILGVAQGIGIGLALGDGTVQGGRPCIPDDVSAASLELVVKMKLGQDLTVFPDDRKLDASGFVGAVLAPILFR